jgi:hypothetical protein
MPKDRRRPQSLVGKHGHHRHVCLGPCATHNIREEFIMLSRFSRRSQARSHINRSNHSKVLHQSQENLQFARSRGHIYTFIEVDLDAEWRVPSAMPFPSAT